MTLRVPKSAIWFNLLVYLLVILGGTEAVLCIEADGRTVMEFVQSECCYPAADATSSKVLSFSSETSPLTDDQCSNCVDIPIFNRKFSQYIISSQNKPAQIQPAVLPPVSSLKLTFEGQRFAHTSSTPFSVANSTITCLHTVVLLI